MQRERGAVLLTRPLTTHPRPAPRPDPRPDARGCWGACEAASCGRPAIRLCLLLRSLGGVNMCIVSGNLYVMAGGAGTLHTTPCSRGQPIILSTAHPAPPRCITPLSRSSTTAYNLRRALCASRAAHPPRSLHFLHRARAPRLLPLPSPASAASLHQPTDGAASQRRRLVASGGGGGAAPWRHCCLRCCTQPRSAARQPGGARSLPAAGRQH